MHLRILLVICVFAGPLRAAGAPRLTPWFSNSYAIVVGVNTYTNSTWPRLNYAVNDAVGIAEYLSTQGFEVISLIESNATRQAIVSAIEDQLAAKLTANDRVLVFFAGHGATRSLGGEDRGYLVPYDGTDAFASLITMHQIRDWSSAMSAAKHQMFILDACFGGLIAMRGSTVDPRTPNYVDDITTRRARQVLTAGGANQRVADGGPNGHSLFTGQLLRALNEGTGDQNGDGFITFTELAGYIQPAASQYNQTPGNSELAGHEQGDFIFTSSSRKRVGSGANGRDSALGGYRSGGDVYKFLKAGKQSFAQMKYDDALSHFKQAAELGNAEAMAFLGKMHWDGLGTATDREKGTEWLLAGAERGDVLAMKSLVTIYSVDDQLNADPALVKRWRNPLEAERWKVAVVEAEMWKRDIVLVDPSGMAGKGDPKIPAANVIVKPLPPTNLRIVPSK